MKGKSFFKKASAVVTGAAAALTVFVGNASAAVDWTGITSLDTTDVDTAMGLIVVALVSMWGYRKVIKTLNRS